MSKHGVRLGAIALASAAAIGVGGASAGAATPAAAPLSLSTIQANAATAITLRVNDLNAAISKVKATTRLGSDSSTLVAYLQSDISPLQALGQKIAGDTTVVTAQADAGTIFTNFRVLALVLPVGRLAAAADVIDVTTIPNLTALAAKAQARVNPTNQAALQPLINDLNAQINAATSATSGVDATLFNDTPAGWNSNHDLLAPARGSVEAAVGNVTKARADVQQIRTLLKAPVAAPLTTPTTTP